MMKICKNYNMNRGLDQEVINQLPIYKFQSSDKKFEEIEKSNTKEDACTICLDCYKENDEIMILPCFHKVNI